MLRISVLRFGVFDDPFSSNLKLIGVWIKSAFDFGKTLSHEFDKLVVPGFRDALNLSA